MTGWKEPGFVYRLWTQVSVDKRPLTLAQSRDLLYVVADQRAIIRTLNGLNYEAYLASEQWQRRREYALERANHRCQLCNYPRALDVHHRTYERIGNEEMDDLIVLCRKCHARHHGLAA